MQKIVPFLWFDGQAEEAMNLYTSIFKNSKIGSVTRCGEMGPGPKGSVLTATFFLDGQEFMALNGGTAALYVDALYHVLLNRSSEGDPGAAGFVSFLQNGGDAAGVVLAIENSSEGSQALANQLYEQFLNRAADPAGLDYWATQLQQGGSAEEQAMVSFLASNEFFNRS